MQTKLIKVIKINLILLSIFIGYYLLNKYTGIYIPCLFKEITNLDCPGCGITRCLFSLLKLNIKDAYNYNQLVTILIIPFIVTYIYYNYCYILNRENKLKNIINKISIYLLVVIILFGVYRNL